MKDKIIEIIKMIDELIDEANPRAGTIMYYMELSIFNLKEALGKIFIKEALEWKSYVVGLTRKQVNLVVEK